MIKKQTFPQILILTPHSEVIPASVIIGPIMDDAPWDYVVRQYHGQAVAKAYEGC